MCNQVTNLIQWKNLSEEERAGFDFENYQYEMQMSGIDPDFYTPDKTLEHMPIGAFVYRLVIQPEKFYWTDFVGAYDGDLEGGIVRGSNITEEHIEDCDWLRPATEAEIPKPERVFKDGAFYPVRCDVTPDVPDVAKYGHGSFDITGQDDPWFECDFSWIGEELTIEWGK